MNFSAFNVKYWVADPKTGLASGRKLSALMWVVMLPFIVISALNGAIDTNLLLVLLGFATGNAGIYGATTPTRGIKNPPENK